MLDNTKLLNDPRFDSYQMFQIRIGLEQGLDVSIYAKPEFKYNQMEQICLGLGQGLDVSIYAKPEFDANQMEQIRLGLQKSIKELNMYIKLNNNKIKELKEQISILEEENKNMKVAVTRKETAMFEKKIVIVINKEKGWRETFLHLSLRYLSLSGELIDIVMEHRFSWNERTFMNEMISRLFTEYDIDKIIVKDYRLPSKIENLCLIEYR